MRRLILALAAVTAMAAAPAQGWGQIKAGPYFAFHEDADLGIGAFVGIPVPEIHENASFVGDFGFFFPGDRHHGATEWDYWEVNTNLTYRFPLEDGRFTPWVLGGLNIGHSSWEVDSEGNLDSSHSDTEIGLNLGGGVTFGSGSTLPFAGVKFEVDGGDGAVIFGGVSFVLGTEG